MLRHPTELMKLMSCSKGIFAGYTCRNKYIKSKTVIVFFKTSIWLVDVGFVSVMYRYRHRKSEKRTHFSSNSVPSSSLRMCLRNWSRRSLRNSSSSKSRKVYWVMRCTALLRQLSFWDRTLYKPNMETTTKKFTNLDIWAQNAFCHKGKHTNMYRQ